MDDVPMIGCRDLQCNRRQCLAGPWVHLILYRGVSTKLILFVCYFIYFI